jgi:choline-sulfatase
VWDDTVVVFTSDHGDMCGEHGMWFKRTLREWSARVPLVVSGGGVAAGRRVAITCSLVDLFPTVMDLAGLQHPTGFTHTLDGASLAPFLTGGARTAEDAGWRNEAILENNGEGTIKPIRALVWGGHKLIYVHDRGPDQFYDLDADPNEWRNLIEAPGEAAGSAPSALSALAASLKARLMDGWDPAETERRVLASQHQRAFLKEALFQGTFTSWDYQPFFDAARQWVRRTSNNQWDPHLGR